MYYKRFIPTSYQESILHIDYNRLKKNGIKYILFDLDNTLLDVENNKVPEKIEKLLVKLSKEFKIIVITNNFKKKIKVICDIIDVDFISFALKPFVFKTKSKLKKYNITNKETCIIGDQLISDVLLGNKLGIKTILVDPISFKDLKITKFNRCIEKHILKKLKAVIERGSYYE